MNYKLYLWVTESISKLHEQSMGSFCSILFILEFNFSIKKLIVSSPPPLIRYSNNGTDDSGRLLIIFCISLVDGRGKLVRSPI